MLRKLPLYPFLLAIWPPLALAAKNLSHINRPSQLVEPLATGILVTMAAWGLAGFCGVKRGFRPIVASVTILGWWGFQWLLHQVNGSPVVHAVGVARFSALIVVLFLTCIIVLLARAGSRGLAAPTAAFNLMCALLLALPVLQVVASGRGQRPTVLEATSLLVTESEISVGELPDPLPDVYIIILDAYTGQHSLLRNYGFDNSDFVSELQARGFLVPQRFVANYPHTAPTIASMMHLDYIDAFAPELDDTHVDWRQVVDRVATNPVWRLFARAGYRQAFYPAVDEITGTNPFATEGIGSDLNLYLHAWRALTPLSELRVGNVPIAVEK